MTGITLAFQTAPFADLSNSLREIPVPTGSVRC